MWPFVSHLAMIGHKGGLQRALAIVLQRQGNAEAELRFGRERCIGRPPQRSAASGHLIASLASALSIAPLGAGPWGQT